MAETAENQNLDEPSQILITYQNAIATWNKLQGNTSLTLLTANEVCKKYLIRTGISLEDLNRVPIIHIAGTKGKGSTCTYLDSILRHHGFKTALYTSPHLVQVRERIRINGKPINEDVFVNKFFHIYNMLDNLKENEFDMPTRLTFMTVLAFHIILDQNIDVAIFEVGLGGEYDATNVIQQPACVGITSLEMDHMNVLGDTLSKITWHKAGIMKKNIPAYTVDQSLEALDVLRERAVEKECILLVVTIDKLKLLNTFPPKLGINSEVQYKNAALALQLAEKFIEIYNENSQKGVINCDKDIVENALINTKWPGRTQTIYGKYLDIYLDAGVTHNAMKNCIDWFKKSIQNNSTVNNINYIKKILIYNTIRGEWFYRDNFDHLKTIDFDLAYFVPNLSKTNGVDLQNTNLDLSEQMKKCQSFKEAWTYCPTIITESIDEAIQHIIDNNNNDKSINNINNNKIAVLISGTVYLMGAALAVLDKDFAIKKSDIIDF